MREQESKSAASDFTVLERAALYARVSGDDRGKEGRNLNGQIEMCREHVQEKGYSNVVELKEDDRGASGVDIDLPQLNKVREMAKARQFDVLVVRELDRLSRSLAKQLIVEEELKQAGVRVEYVLAEYDDTPEGRLNKHIRATIAEYEREKIRERSTRGRRNKAKSGKVIVHGNPPYGYRLNDDKTELVVCESEAEIIRLIFDLCVNEGLSNRAISQRLDKMGVSTPKAIKGNQGGWWMSTVSRILRKEVYIGRWHYGKNGTNGKNKRESWVAVEVPKIVDLDIWEAAQEKLKNNKRFSKRNRIHNYLMSGRAACGCGCGYNLTGVSRGREYRYYAKMFGNKLLTECTAPYFRANHVDTAVWEWIKSILTDEEKLTRGLEEYQSGQKEKTTPLRNRLEVLNSLLEKHTNKLNRLLDIYLSGDVDKEIFLERKSRLETAVNGLEKEQANLKAQIEQGALTDAQVQSIIEFARKVRRGIQLADQDFEAKRKIIELLDVRVTLVVEDGQKVALARCILDQKDLSIMNPKRRFFQ